MVTSRELLGAIIMLVASPFIIGIAGLVLYSIEYIICNILNKK